MSDNKAVKNTIVDSVTDNKTLKNTVIEATEESASATKHSKYSFTNIDDIPTNRDYTKSTLQIGQEKHKQYFSDIADGQDYVKEYVLPSKKRIDFVDFTEGTIHELKPYNSRSIKAGEKQLSGYLNEIKEVFPDIDWKTQLDVY